MTTVAPIAITAGLPNASTHQIAIFEAVMGRVRDILNRTASRSIIIKAVAGAGKSTTVAAASRLVPDNLKVIFLAFGRKVVTELKGKLPQGVDCDTINARGMKIWSRYILGRDRVKLDIQTSKMRAIIDSIMSKDQQERWGEQVHTLIDMARAHGVVPEGVPNCRSIGGTVTLGDSNDVPLMDCPEFWEGIIVHHSVPVPVAETEIVLGFVRDALRRDLMEEHVIDLTDQVYFPVVKRTAHGGPIPTFYFSVVIVDEAQDLNPAQRAMVHMLRRADGVVIAVGDKRQAIFGFNGADINSLDSFQSDFQAEEYSLPITWRCAKNIVQAARKLYPEIEAAPNAPDGIVATISSYRSDAFKAGDLIICRNNSPLISSAFKLIRNGVSCTVLGRDIGAGLRAILKKISRPETAVSDMIEGLNQWKERQIAILKARDKYDEEGVQRINDKVDTIMVFADEYADGTVSQILDHIEKLFSDPDGDLTNKVILSTIHKAKGSEAERVFFLDRHLMYASWVRDGWQLIQEKNLEYVALTRPKLCLYTIRTDDHNDNAKEPMVIKK